MEWFKFYGGAYLSDPKMLMLTACERSCWITLLSFASVAEDGGRIKYLSEPQLMTAAGVSPMHDEWDMCVGVLEKLESLGMITVSNEVITINNWQKRQESYLTNAERQKRYREKHKSNVIVTKSRNESNARIEENRIDTSANAQEIEEVKDPLTPERQKKDTAYLEVFRLWGNYPLNWGSNRTEIQSAKNLLEEKGLEACKQALLFSKKHKDEQFCPKIRKPSDLDRKWLELKDYEPA